MTSEEWGAAIIAQFIGVSITLLAFGSLAWASNVVAWRPRVIIPFFVTYMLFVLALPTLVFPSFGSNFSFVLDYLWKLVGGNPQLIEWRAKFTIITLYIDVICLAWLVLCSGGTGHPTESIFTPIFVVTPHLALAFLQPIASGQLHIVLLALLTLAFYVFSYWIGCHAVEIEKEKESKYRLLVVAVVVLSILQSVGMPFLVHNL